MKKINKIVFLLSLAFLFSCNDATDIQQEGIIYEEDGFTTLRDLKTGLNGAYAAYGPDFGGDAIFFNDVFTDNVKRGDSNTGGGTEEYNFLLQPNSDAPTTIWGNRYAAINRINRSLDAYDRLYDGFTELEVIQADHVKANLLALRALCHLNLFEYFTPDYKDGNGLSVIKMDFVPADYRDVFPRNTVSEILTFIKEDLENALTLFKTEDEIDTLDSELGATIANEYTNYFYLTARSVAFLKAKIALYEGNYPLAQTLAQDAINAAGVVLSPKTVYTSMFSDTAQGESVFTLSRLSGNNGIVLNYYFNTGSGGPTDDILQVSRQLYELYENNDIRKTVVIRNADNASSTFLVGKYVGSADGTTINDIKVFRLSEMKLILAEAKARNGNLVGAANDVRDIRNARIGGAPLPVYADLNAALADILLERRKELAFEGHRYLDIKRIGNDINVGINRLQVDAATFSAPLALPASDYRFTFPIPQNEIFANPTIGQNPNY